MQLEYDFLFSLFISFTKDYEDDYLNDCINDYLEDYLDNYSDDAALGNLDEEVGTDMNLSYFFFLSKFFSNADL